MDSKSTHYLGINIGGTGCSLVTGTVEGRLLERVSWSTSEARAPGEALDRITAEVDGLICRGELCGAGVAIGGPLDTRTGTVLSPPNLPDWDSVPLKAELEARLSLRVNVAHDAAACALAEARFGTHRGCRSLVYLTCGTGFGAGMVVDGKMVESGSGIHPEIGHWRLMENGPEAFGRAGCAEALCSGPGISRIAAWLHPVRWSDPLPAPESITELARRDDAEAWEVVDFHALMTGRVCAMIAELVCPDYILLGSLAQYLGEFWVEPVVRHYRDEVLDRIGQAVQVVPATLGADLQDLSALAVAL